MILINVAKSESTVPEKEHEGREEADKENLQFQQKRDMLYEECEDFMKICVILWLANKYSLIKINLRLSVYQKLFPTIR
jgi:hypothetical protein